MEYLHVSLLLSGPCFRHHFCLSSVFTLHFITRFPKQVPRERLQVCESALNSVPQELVVLMGFLDKEHRRLRSELAKDRYMLLSAHAGISRPVYKTDLRELIGKCTTQFDKRLFAKVAKKTRKFLNEY